MKLSIMIIAVLMLFIAAFIINANELTPLKNGIITFNFIHTANDLSTFSLNMNNYKKDKISDEDKPIIFDKPDFAWLKEKNRLEKIFLAVGIVTAALGGGVLLAGLINLLVNFDAVTIDNVPIDNSYYVYYSLIGTGSGLIAVGSAFIITGAVRIGIKNKKAKAEIGFLSLPLQSNR